MKTPSAKYFRILAIAPSSRGFGYALLEGDQTLVDWGVKAIKRDKDVRTIAKAKKLIGHFHPGVIVLEDTAAMDSRRSPRIRELSGEIAELAKSQGVPVGLLPRGQVKSVFFADGTRTKQALAEVLAMRFPEELGPRLPPKRRPWTSEDYRMDIFDAVALALAFRLRKSGKPFETISTSEIHQNHKPEE